MRLFSFRTIKKNEGRKMRRGSETCGTPSSLPTNICIVEVPEGEDRDKGAKKRILEEIIAKKLPNFRKKH